MIIEFTGIAGSGKSHILNLIYEQLKKNDIEVVKDKEFSKMNYLLPNNIFLCIETLLYVIFKVKPKSLTLGIKSFLVWYKVQVKLKKYKNSSNVVLIDEGYFHKFRFLRRNSKIDNLSLETIYNKRFNLPNVVILVDISVDDLKENILNRDKKKLDMSINEYEQSIERTEKDIQKVLGENREMKYIRIKNQKVLNIEGILKELDVFRND